MLNVNIVNKKTYNIIGYSQGVTFSRLPSCLHPLDSQWLAWCTNVPSLCKRLLYSCQPFILQFSISLLEWFIPWDVSWLKLLSQTSRDDAELTVGAMLDNRLGIVHHATFLCNPLDYSLVKVEQVTNMHHPVFCELFVHPAISTRTHETWVTSGMGQTPLRTTKGFSFTPSTIEAIRTTVKHTFSCPIVFSVTDLVPTHSTVVLTGISRHHEVSFT